MPWPDLAVLSEWASIAGFLLSIWVLVRTYRVEEAVRTTESMIYQRLRLPDRIEKIKVIRGKFHTLARAYDDSSDIDVHEAFGQLDAIISQLLTMPNSNVQRCLKSIASKRSRCGPFWKPRRELTQDDVISIYEYLTELSEHLNESKSQDDILGIRT